ncbi:MAG: mandelate racemase/muconate lactonizing enzyme family protein [Chloroflexi bacterium]|nr:mandelate racemase/muconate lactonizing enzyme family protein [Chloroflexota bacterium]
MKIANIAIVPLTAPYTWPNLPANDRNNGVRNCVWVRIDTDEGVSGWGEAYPGVYATEVTIEALHRLSPSLLGQEISDPNEVLAQMRYRNRYWAMRGIGAQSTSALEAALWDITGIIQGKPLWQMLGDGQPHPVLLYASDGSNALLPKEIYDEASGYMAQGFRAYKMRCGGTSWDPPRDRLALDTERVSAARLALGPERLLFVDVSVPQRPETWQPGVAEAYMRALSPYKVRFMEEPAMTYDVERYRELQHLGLIPTAGGESFACPEEFEPFFAAGALGVAQPDAAVVGGPASCVEVCNRAREHGVPVCLHCFSAGVGIAQNLHAAASVPGVLAMEGPQAIHATATVPLKQIWDFHDGYLTSPTRPGLGVEITAELLAEYPYRPDSERDY